ncbi:MAG: ribosome-binding factor A [Verrucomicrobia bacterium TMED56]|nr:MAG: ribosome-binding factor A [Verrucomicrobia bacterium TMED56]
MSLRLARVNELVLREIATYLSTRYRSESVRWTITSVDVSADLRNAKVAYSVIGEETHAREAMAFFRKHAGEIRKVVSTHVILKYSPQLHFVRDYGIERGNRVMEILDDLESDKDAEES